MTRDTCRVRISGDGPSFIGQQLDGQMTWPFGALELREVSGREKIFAINDFTGSTDPAHNQYKDFLCITVYDPVAQKLITYFDLDEPFLVPDPLALGVNPLKLNANSSENLQPDGRYYFKGHVGREEESSGSEYDPAGPFDVNTQVTDLLTDILHTAGINLIVEGDGIWIDVVRNNNKLTIKHTRNNPPVWKTLELLKNGGGFYTVEIDHNGHVISVDGEFPYDDPNDPVEDDNSNGGSEVYTTTLLSSPNSGDVRPEHML